MKKAVLLFFLMCVAALPAQQARFQLSCSLGGLVSASGLGSTVPLADGGYATLEQLQDTLPIAPFNVTNRLAFLRYDNNGELVVSRRYSNYFTTNSASDICSTRDSGFLIAASIYDTSVALFPNYYTTNLLLLKTDGLGDISWQRAYRPNLFNGVSHANCVEELADGGFIVGGTCFDPTSANATSFLMRIDALGTIVWNRTFSSPSYDQIVDLEVLPDGGFICVGFGGTVAVPFHLSLFRTDSLGALLWYRLLDSPLLSDYEYATGVDVCTNGDVVISGFRQDTSGESVVAARFDQSGTILWSRGYGLAGHRAQGFSIDEMQDGSLAIGFNFRIDQAPYVNTPGMLRLRPNGDFRDAVLYGDSSGGYFINAGTVADGGLWLQTRRYVGALISGQPTRSDFALLKTDTALSTGCDERPITLTEVPFVRNLITTITTGSANVTFYNPNITSTGPIATDELKICFEKGPEPPVPVAIPEPVSLPNVFSPNGDGVNDVFVPFNTDNVRYRMRIYNRWGNLLATLENTGWDGRDAQGALASDGTYYYVCELENQVFSGFLTLIKAQ